MLLKVMAVGVNPIDVKIRDGSSFVSEQLQLPSGLGYDICGEVIECGADIKGFKPGDIVLGSVGRYMTPCAYSEYCLAKPDDVIVKPDALGAVDAGALPIAGLTAWQALHQYGQVQQGERVLIQAAAGGVGHLAVQFAKLAGAYVIAAASEKHHAFLNDLGVDEIIDYRKQAFDEVLSDIDLVLDLVGAETGLRSLTVLKKGGRIVTVPTITRDQILEKAKTMDIKAMGMLAETNQKDLTMIAGLIAQGKVKMNIAKNVPAKRSSSSAPDA